MNILIKNGRMIDPASEMDEKVDILISNGKIAKVEKNLQEKAEKIIDATGCFVMPGFVDLHVHLREPGQEQKETIESGAKAAAKGGFTTILAMPNTKPVADNEDIVNFIHNKAKAVACVNVLQVGAITKGQEGQELARIEQMIAAGIPALSEDGKSVMNSFLYKKAMKMAVKHNIPVLAHCEDINMVNQGVVNADEKMKALGLPGISNGVEDVIIARDILLAKEVGVHLHLCHCSTKNSVMMVQQAKLDQLKVTAEVCPHHFTLSTEDIVTADSNYKMNPPLRTKEDVDALKEGLKHGIMEVIATDHAPHSIEDKAKGMKNAPFGIVGLETAAALTMTELVDQGYLTPMQMAEKLSYNPAKIIGLDRGSLEIGKIADVVIFDPQREYIIKASEFVSKGKNTPFDGRKVKGQVIATLVSGNVVYEINNKHKR